MAKHHKCPEHVNHERWLVSYADFITLLFAFFTVLYAISNTDSKKVEKFVGSAERSFSMGIFPNGSQSIMLGEATTSAGAGVYDMGIKMTDVEKSLKMAMVEEEKEGKISIEKKDDGLLITLKTFGFFMPGSDALNPNADETLRRIGQQLRRIPNDVRIEGHTDNRPVKGGRFQSNWDLSSSRAIAVLKELQKSGVAEDRFSVIGYAEHRPVAFNRTEQGRALNRRVEIFVIEKNPRIERHKLMGQEMGIIKNDLEKPGDETEEDHGHHS